MSLIFLLLVALKPHNKGTDKEKAKEESKAKLEESKGKIEEAKGDGASAANKTTHKATEGGAGVGAAGMEGSTGGAGIESSATMPEACNGMLAILQDETVMQTVDAILRVAMLAVATNAAVMSCDREGEGVDAPDPKNAARAMMAINLLITMRLVVASLAGVFATCISKDGFGRKVLVCCKAMVKKDRAKDRAKVVPVKPKEPDNN